MPSNCIECIVITENNPPLFTFSTPFANPTDLYQTLLPYFMGIQRQLLSQKKNPALLCLSLRGSWRMPLTTLV